MIGLERRKNEGCHDDQESYDIFYLRETNVRQKIAQLIFRSHKDIVFCQVVIPYKGQVKNKM